MFLKIYLTEMAPTQSMSNKDCCERYRKKNKDLYHLKDSERKRNKT